MKKRFIVGLREVARSVKVSQIKLIVLAPDIEESSAPGNSHLYPGILSTKLIFKQKALMIA